jgi:hypothetical protein
VRVIGRDARCGATRQCRSQGRKHNQHHASRGLARPER